MAPLKRLVVERDSIFSRLQNICDKIKNIDSEEFNNESFFSDLETVDSLRADFESVLYEIAAHKLKLNPDYVNNYYLGTFFVR